jgi:hypothetical protein
MPYHTAAPTISVIPASYKLVFEENGYTAYEWSGRLFLYRKGCSLAQLVNGFESLKKSYRNSFEIWIDKVKEKDLAKIENIKADIALMLKDCDTIRDVHS